MLLFEAQCVIKMIIRKSNFETNLKITIMELGPFMHKHPILDLGPL